MNTRRLPDYIRQNWHKLPAWRKCHIRLLVTFSIPKNRTILKLITTTTIATLIIFPIFPPHPLSLPASLGSALSIAMIIGVIK